MQDNKVKNLKIVTVAVLIFIVLLFAALVINLVRLGKANARERQLTAELARLEAQYEDGEDEISSKQSKDYIVRYAREYLNMKGKDETAFTGKED